MSQTSSLARAGDRRPSPPDGTARLPLHQLDGELAGLPVEEVPVEEEEEESNLPLIILLLVVGPPKSLFVCCLELGTGRLATLGWIQNFLTLLGFRIETI